MLHVVDLKAAVAVAAAAVNEMREEVGRAIGHTAAVAHGAEIRAAPDGLMKEGVKACPVAVAVAYPGPHFSFYAIDRCLVQFKVHQSHVGFEWKRRTYPWQKRKTALCAFP